MADRYSEDIKRIVGIDPNQKVLKDPKRRPNIGSKRGIGYFDSAGNPGSTSGSGGSTEPTDATAPKTTPQGQDRDGAQPTTTDNPYSGIISSGTGSYEAEALIDGTVDAAQVGIFENYDDDGIEGGAALRSIKAEDCTTGDKFEIFLTQGLGLPTPATEDDQGNTISNRWEDAETPPELYGWTSGLEWKYGGSSNWWASPMSAVREYQNVALVASGYEVTGQRWISGDAINGGIYRFEYLVGAVPASADVTISSQSCTPAAGSASCPITTPLETEWAPSSDNRFKIEFSDGHFSTSQYDPLVPTDYKPDQGLIDFCFDGGRTGTAEAGRDGTLLLYETSGGAPTGIIRVYDKAGRLTAAFDGTSSALDSYRPL